VAQSKEGTCANFFGGYYDIQVAMGLSCLSFRDPFLSSIRHPRTLIDDAPKAN
jgi:hypothetical protein